MNTIAHLNVHEYILKMISRWGSTLDRPEYMLAKNTLLEGPLLIVGYFWSISMGDFMASSKDILTQICHYDKLENTYSEYFPQNWHHGQGSFDSLLMSKCQSTEWTLKNTLKYSKGFRGEQCKMFYSRLITARDLLNLIYSSLKSDTNRNYTFLLSQFCLDQVDVGQRGGPYRRFMGSDLDTELRLIIAKNSKTASYTLRHSWSVIRH